MVKLSCKESGLECDYIAEGRTVEEVLKHISEHAMNIHNMEQKTYMKKIYLPPFYAMPSVK